MVRFFCDVMGCSMGFKLYLSWFPVFWGTCPGMGGRTAVWPGHMAETKYDKMPGPRFSIRPFWWDIYFLSIWLVLYDIWCYNYYLYIYIYHLKMSHQVLMSVISSTCRCHESPTNPCRFQHNLRCVSTRDIPGQSGQSTSDPRLLLLFHIASCCFLYSMRYVSTTINNHQQCLPDFWWFYHDSSHL